MALANGIFKENDLKFKVSVDMSELENALKMAEKLVELLKLAQELSAVLPQNKTE